MHAQLLIICHRCPQRQRDCRGGCDCTVDGRDITAHARERHCPEGRFRLGLGDMIARVTHLLGIQRLLRRRKWRCGCAGRQNRLNGWFGWPKRGWLSGV
jgi:hypothetical protein